MESSIAHSDEKFPLFSIRGDYTCRFFSNRPENTVVDTLVIHSIAPEDMTVLSAWQALEAHEVSCHYLIDRDGTIYSMVPEELRAWHAGPSKMPFDDDQREVVNDFSIGVELLTDVTQTFTEAQYYSLTLLISSIRTRQPLNNIVSHQVIAPTRKVDPGENFDWSRYEGIGLRVGY